MGEHPTRDRDTLSDELLAIRCQLGEGAAFDTLVERWHPPLWKYLRRLAGDDDAAAETLQDVWLRIFRALPTLRDPARLRAWLFGIARRALMDRLRRQYSERPIEEVDLDAIAASDDTDGLADEIERMGEELQRLPIVEREVLVLFYLQELTLTQVADVLGVPVGTVKSRLFRARQLLRHRLTATEVMP